MDESVRAAMQRWPDVPAVYGWLSLTARGVWHIHPDGGAVRDEPGEAITNAQLITFINRNYLHDDHGRWFFQNGPQRVYLDVALAPYIFRLQDDGQGLVSHTGQEVTAIQRWWLDTDGVLFAQTDVGPGAVLDRDLAAVVERLKAPEGRCLADHLEDGLPPEPIALSWPGLPGQATLHSLKARDRAHQLEFDPAPRPKPG